MGETFEIEVAYKGELLNLPAEYLPMGYSFKIRINIDGTDIFFERDDEKNYRAIASPEDFEKSKNIDTELLAAIAQALQESL